MQIPKIDKIVVNCGCGEARDNSKVLEAVVGDLTKITGQKAIITKAKKSVANFKLREGMPIGAKVTLRGDRMWEFLDRLFNVALPRVRDFRGINPNAFDGRGNYGLGIKEQLIFPRDRVRQDRQDPRHGHLHLHHRDDRRGSQGTADHGRRSVPRLIGRKNTMARKASDPEAAGWKQVLHPPLQPLQDLRPSPRLPAGLRHLPYLLPRAGLQGSDSRCQEGELVKPARLLAGNLNKSPRRRAIGRSCLAAIPCR